MGSGFVEALDGLKEAYESDIEQAIHKAIAEHEKWVPVGKALEPVSSQMADNAYCYAIGEAQRGNAEYFKQFPKYAGMTDVQALQEAQTILGLGFDTGEDVERRLDDTTLWDIQDAIFKRYDTDPNFRGIVDNLVIFTIGRGIKFECLNADVNALITRFWAMNKMDQRQKRCVRDFGMEGEYFFHIMTSGGDTYLRKAPPKRILSIETDPDDIEVLLSHEYQYPNGSTRKWIADVDYFEQLEGPFSARSHSHDQLTPDDMMLFIKNGFDDELRGRPQYRPALKALKYLEDFLTDRVTYHHERARVIMFKKMDRSVAKDFAAMVGTAFKMPKGGLVLHEITDGDLDLITYRFETPKLESKEASEDHNMVAHTVAAAAKMPLFVWQQRGDVAVYASIKRQEMPFSQTISDCQDTWMSVFDKLFRVALGNAVRAGKIPATVEVPKYASDESSTLEALSRIDHQLLEDSKVVTDIIKLVKEEEKTVTVDTVRAPISITFPEVIREDPAALAEYLKTVYEIGSAEGLSPVSMQWVSNKLGVSYNRMFAERMIALNMAKEIASLDTPDWELGEPGAVPPTGDEE